MGKNAVKFSLMALGIAALGTGAIYGVDWLRYKKSPEYQMQMQIEEVKKEYNEDPYGGDTPEETLRLFIDALIAGDTDLAAKYFVLDVQEEWREDLARIKEKGLLDEMIQDVKKLGNKYPFNNLEDKFIFEAYDIQNELILQASIQKISNGKWKIQDL